MSGDYSRDSFDPRKHFNGLLQQQGRVHLESNANELVRIVDRRLRAQTADTLGRAVVPRQTPRGFQITMTNGSLTIGRGRMYVDGLLVENHGKGATTFDGCLAEQLGDEIDYDEQPYLPSAATVAPLPTAAGPHLAYIVAYERELTHHAYPTLVESAIGQDTVTALQVLWQVRVLDDVPVGTTCATPDEQIPKWQTLIRPSGGRLTTHKVEVPEETDPCIIASGSGGYRGLENQLYRVEIHQGGQIGAATFKWSRENASVATTVIAANGKTISVTSIGKDSVLRIHEGDWVEITDDWREFSGEPPEMRKVSNVDFAARTFEIDPPLPAAFPVDAQGKLKPERHTRIRRWDQNGTDVDAASGTILVPAAGARVALEHGVEVSFDVETTGEFKPGDFWTFAASVATADVDHPLDKAPPRGIHRHYARLAVITSPTKATDCRVLWPSQAEKPADRPLRVKDVTVAGAPLQNDTDIQASVLARGIIIHFTDGEPNPLAVRGKPVCHVTLDLPYPLNDTDINMWAGLRAPGLLGSQPLVLAGFALAEENRIQWAPQAPAKEWLRNGALFERLRQREYEPRILARLTLKGNFIWSRESPDRYLDGDTFGRHGDRSVEWRVPSGDGQRGGDFEIWFWVTR